MLVHVDNPHNRLRASRPSLCSLLPRPDHRALIFFGSESASSSPCALSEGVHSRYRTMPPVDKLCTLLAALVELSVIAGVDFWKQGEGRNGIDFASTSGIVDPSNGVHRSHPTLGLCCTR